jgi:hypothetical protein
MTKLTYLVLGLLVLSGTLLMVGVAPGRRGISSTARDSMDIRAIERGIDIKALANGDLDQAVYQ